MELNVNVSDIEKEVLKNLTVYDVSQKKTRIGRIHDGGYVIVDDHSYDLYLSCGVGGEVSFDIEFLDKYKIESSLSFDGTCTPPADFPKTIKHHDKNIGITNDSLSTDLIEETSNYKDIFMKMDIEGYEWDWINHFPLKRIKQFVIECHGFFDSHHPLSWANTHGLNFTQRTVLSALEKINKTHVLVHLHGNNGGFTRKSDNSLSFTCGVYGEEIFTVAELTFLRRDCVDITKINTENLPIDGLDFRNFEQHIEIPINMQPFVNIK